MAMSTRRLADGGVVFSTDTAEGYLRVEADVAGNVLACEIEVKSRGLGDTVAKITSAVGIRPCGGCKKRQTVLNTMVPYAQRNLEGTAR